MWRVAEYVFLQLFLWCSFSLCGSCFRRPFVICYAVKVLKDIQKQGLTYEIHGTFWFTAMIDKSFRPSFLFNFSCTIISHSLFLYIFRYYCTFENYYTFSPEYSSIPDTTQYSIECAVLSAQFCVHVPYYTMRVPLRSVLRGVVRYSIPLRIVLRGVVQYTTDTM